MRILKRSIIILAVCLLLIGTGIGKLYFSADMKEPDVSAEKLPEYILQKSDSLRMYGPNRLQLNESGLWEMALEGDAFERGVASGKLSEDLLYYQEKVFVDQIREFIPSDGYLRFLRFLLILFNRNLGTHIPEEFRKEIYGISLSCTHEYDAIGTPYQRQLNYHAAHDIGHAMQDYMLVGCSSFGVWGTQSEDAGLLIGRNFDFYIGDDFARHKLVSFYNPADGYKFASIGWAGMTGVLSGMNEMGLTVTINAAKSTMPLSAAMPISLLAREILQYASTIEEAYTIVARRKTFVAESLLIGSAKDNKAAIIEKSTDKIALYTSDTDRIVCTNHYQSETFLTDKRNMENIATSDSPYRSERLNELLNSHTPVNPEKAASILRDRFGMEGKEIGLANEKAINQFIAHHSVIFQPEKLRMWVSASPWQLGKYVAYDLKELFTTQKEIKTIDSLVIAADTFLYSPLYTQLQDYRRCVKIVKESIRKQQRFPNDLMIDSLLNANPEMYDTWLLAGDYFNTFEGKERAIPYWEKALTKEIPKQDEREAINKRITKKE